MADIRYQEPFEGYDAAIGGLQGASTAVAPGMGGDFQSKLLQALMAPSPMQDQKTPQEPPKWLYMIPGFAKGVAMRRQMDAQEEELKLRKQQLAGQQAMQRLQQLQLAQKIEQQQALQHWGTLYGGLMRNEDVLDPEAKRELEGRLVEGLAKHGNPEQVQKFIEARQAQRQLDAANQIFGQAADAPPATATPAAPPSATPAPAPPGPRAVYEQMARQVATQMGVNPDLAVAVMHQESSGNPAAIGDGGQSVGLFQLQPDAAKEMGLDPAKRLDPQANIRAGVGYLKKQLDATGGNVTQALERYNGGGTPGYAQQVQARMGGSPAAAPAVPQVQQDQQELQQLQQQATLIQRQMNQVRPFLGNAKVKAMYEARKDELASINKRMTALQKQAALGANEVDRLASATFGAPFARLPQPQQQQVLALQQQREVEKRAAIGQNAAAIAAQRAKETELGKSEGERLAKEQLSLAEVEKDDSRNYVNRQTGENVPQSTPYLQVKNAMKDQAVVRLKDDEYKVYQGIQRLSPLMGQIRGNIEKVYGPGGIYENLTPQQRLVAAAKGGWARLAQTNPDLEITIRDIQGNIDLIRRNLQGQVGTQTEQDAKRGLTAISKLDGIPDTKEVAFRTYNELLNSVNGSLQTILGNPQFVHPRMQPLETAPAAGFKILSITPRP